MQQNKAILPLSDILAENTIKIGGLNGDLIVSLQNAIFFIQSNK